MIEPNGDGTFQTTFATDEEQTIRGLSGGGVTCVRDDDTERTDTTPTADLSFDVRATDNSLSANLKFVIAVTVPALTTPTLECPEATIEWEATASRLDAD